MNTLLAKRQVLGSFTIFFLLFVNETKIEFIFKTCKGLCILPKQHLNVKMFSNLKNKSIAVKLPDKTSLLHGNITLKWNVKWSKCSRPFFFLNLNITRERNPYTMIECLIYWICKSKRKFHAALLIYFYITVII